MSDIAERLTVAIGVLSTLTMLACADGSVVDAGTDVAPSGSLHLTTATTGPRPDPNGYTLLIDGTQYGTIGASAERIVQVTPGSHVVSLDGLARACAIDGTASRSATVTAGQTTEVHFDIECPPKRSPRSARFV